MKLKKVTRYFVIIRFGSEGFASKDTEMSYSFDTESEKDAFLYGIDEASGWLDYEVIKEGNNVTKRKETT